MIRIQLVDPELLPARIPGIALHRPGYVLIVLKRSLTPEQIAEWISRLGLGISREAIDATVARSKAAP